jgi:hypothetical protein
MQSMTPSAVTSAVGNMDPTCSHRQRLAQYLPHVAILDSGSTIPLCINNNDEPVHCL